MIRAANAETHVFLNYPSMVPRLLWAAIPMTALLVAACGPSAAPRPVESARPTLASASPATSAPSSTLSTTSPTPTSASSPTPFDSPTGNAGVAPESHTSAASHEPLPTPPRTKDGHPIVYITFDDGPSDRYTNEILDTLAKHHATATFFVVGKRAMRLPSIVQLTLSAGHTVASHTWSHPHLDGLSRSAIAEQLAHTRSTLSALGASTRCFRPPFGGTDRQVRRVARSLGLREYLWTTESKDWTKAPAEQTARIAAAGLTPGAIIVFHDGSASGSTSTIHAVDQLLTIAETKGYVTAALPC